MRRKTGAVLAIEQAILSAGLDLFARSVEEFHGFMIASEIRDRAGARLLTAHGTLYKALERMEAAGWLTSRWEDPLIAARDGRPRRRLYRVTAAGQAALATTEGPQASPVPGLATT